VFYEALRFAIPSLVGLLKHRDFNVLSAAAVSALESLAKHGELQ
jgi:hypothetical protein